MESLDQEIARNKQMASEYYRIANLFTILCCIFTPLLLIGTYNYNSKAKRCWRRIRELEVQKQQQSQKTPAIYCHSCGHTIKEVLEFCPQCGEKIKYIEEYRNESAKLQQEAEMLEIEAEILYQETQLKNIEKRKKFAIITSSIVMPVSVVLAFFAPIALGVCNFLNVVSLLASIINFGKVPKDQKRPIKPLILSIVSLALTLGLFILTIALTPNIHNYAQPFVPLWRYF